MALSYLSAAPQMAPRCYWLAVGRMQAACGPPTGEAVLVSQLSLGLCAQLKLDGGRGSGELQTGVQPQSLMRRSGNNSFG